MVFQGINEAVEAMNRGPSQHWNRSPSVNPAEVPLPGKKASLAAAADALRRGSKGKPMNGTAASPIPLNVLKDSSQARSRSRTTVNPSDPSQKTNGSANGTLTNSDKTSSKTTSSQDSYPNVTGPDLQNTDNLFTVPNQKYEATSESVNSILTNYENCSVKTITEPSRDSKSPSAYDTCLEISESQPNAVHIKLTQKPSVASNGIHADKHELQTGVAYNRSNSTPCPVATYKRQISPNLNQVALSLTPIALSEPSLNDDDTFDANASPSGSASRSQEQSPNTQTSYLVTDDDMNEPPLIVIQSASTSVHASPEGPEESDTQRLTTSSTLKKSVSFADETRDSSDSNSGTEDARTSLLNRAPLRLVRKHKPPKIVIDGKHMPVDSDCTYPGAITPRTPAYSSNGHQFHHFQEQVSSYQLPVITYQLTVG